LTKTRRLRRLFPAGACAVELVGSGDASGLHPAEAEHVRGAVPKRRAEFAAGRWCARHALAELGIVDFTLLPNADRSPRWPPGVVGSITHTDGYCAAVVADARRFRAIGVDAEIVGRVTGETWPQLFTEPEDAQLAAAPPAERARVATIMFSAKEAFYKCQYVLTEAWVGFHDVWIDLAPIDADANAGTFTVRSAGHLPMLDAIVPLDGRFAVDGALVLTGMAIVA
jgi:4'-phosphopantetheinyl transferase EntD